MMGCPSRQELERFLGEVPGTPESERIVHHLEDCEDCRRTLDGLAIVDGLWSSVERSTAVDERDASLIERLRAAGPPAIPEGTEEPSRVEPGPLPEISGFRILREVGRGGMGVVYEAEDLALNRRVALKVLAPMIADDPRHILRFEREARAAARLHHTRIVPVFGVGRQEGYCYYVMQFIDGRGLDRAVVEWRRSPQNRPSACEIARIGEQVAEALDHAHAQGILHRDIKPSNLLLDEEGDVWVADFGLAKTSDGDDLTRSEDVLGTIRYMGPERFRGACDRRSDVYSLGLTLYELIARRPAFSASDRYAMIERVRNAAVDRLSQMAPGVPRDLETIVHKAIAAEPAARYATAGELAEDLRRFQQNRPIRARRVSLVERLVRWCRRNPWAAAFLVALGAGLVASTWQAVRATRAESAARADRDRAERSFGRAVVAIRNLLLQEGVDQIPLREEELRPYLRSLIEAGLRETQRLIVDLEAEPGLQGQLVEAYHALARIQSATGESVAAVASARQAIAVSERLFAREPTFENGRYLAHSLQLIIQISRDFEAGREAVRRSSEVLRQIRPQAPAEFRLEVDALLAKNEYLVGESFFQAGRPVESIAAFDRAREASERTLRDHDPDSGTRYMLALTERYLCRVLPAANRIDDAIAAGRRAVALLEALHREGPNDFNRSWDLYLAYEELGLRHFGADATVEALAAYKQCERVLERIDARSDLLASRRLTIRLALARVLHNRVAATDSDPARFAAIRWGEPLRIAELYGAIAAIRPLPTEHLSAYALACWQLAGHRERDDGRLDLEWLRRSERLYAEALAKAPGSVEARAYLFIVRRLLSEELAARGDAGEADRFRREADRDATVDPVVLVEIAREYARYVLDAVAAPTAKIAGSRQRRFTRHALATLREAIKAGFRDVSDFHDDPLLAPFRARPEYQAIVGDIGFPADPFSR